MSKAVNRPDRRGYPEPGELRRAIRLARRDHPDELNFTESRILDRFADQYQPAYYEGPRGQPPVVFLGAWGLHTYWKSTCECKARMKRSPNSGRLNERCLRHTKRSRNRLVESGWLELVQPSVRGGREKRRRDGRMPGRAHGYRPGPKLRRYLAEWRLEPLSDRSRPVPQAIQVPIDPENRPHTVDSRPVDAVSAPAADETQIGPFVPKRRRHLVQCRCEACMASKSPP